MAGKGKATVLLVSAFQAPFIDDDAAIISSVHTLVRSTGGGIRALVRLLGTVPRCDLFFSWFLSVYGAFGVILARLLGRPSVVVLGGVDVARDRDLRYGLWLSPWRALLARRALRSATLVLAVHESLKEKAVRLAHYDGRNIRHLPTGYDPAVWTPGNGREIDVLCVASVSDETRFLVKGIDLLISAARELPETGFTVVGVKPAVASWYSPPANMVFRDAVSRSELPRVYASARVYCQPSRHEGLPNALCEAMLCGCVPVATDVGGCRTAVGDAGFLVPPGEGHPLAVALREALDADVKRSTAGRERIARMFPMEKRRTTLLEMLSVILTGYQ